MTDREKFYKLALNIVNYPYKEAKFFYDAISQFIISDGENKLCFYCFSICTEIYAYHHDEFDVHVYEDNPCNIDELIDHIKTYFPGIDILEGIE